MPLFDTVCSAFSTNSSQTVAVFSFGAESSEISINQAAPKTRTANESAVRALRKIATGSKAPKSPKRVARAVSMPRTNGGRFTKKTSPPPVVAAPAPAPAPAPGPDPAVVANANKYCSALSSYVRGPRCEYDYVNNPNARASVESAYRSASMLCGFSSSSPPFFFVVRAASNACCSGGQESGRRSRHGEVPRFYCEPRSWLLRLLETVS
jgi:hypothetical protein